MEEIRTETYLLNGNKRRQNDYSISKQRFRDVFSSIVWTLKKKKKKKKKVRSGTESNGYPCRRNNPGENDHHSSC